MVTLDLGCCATSGFGRLLFACGLFGDVKHRVYAHEERHAFSAFFIGVICLIQGLHSLNFAKRVRHLVRLIITFQKINENKRKT